jgi:hypothetical protein
MGKVEKLPADKPADDITDKPADDTTSTPIAKPKAGNPLDKFRSKKAANVPNVGDDPGPLKIDHAARVKDFVRVHPNEEDYWSPELCFVEVPIPGARDLQLHLIVEDIAVRYLPSAKIIRHRLVLASKPRDQFFLARIPTQNLDNPWHISYLHGCEVAKTKWVELTSRRNEGKEGYHLTYAHDADAFPTPKWPADSLDEIITRAFGPDRMITDDNHPGLLRLIGKKQELA